MKFFDHTIYTSTKIDRHDKTSALSVPSVVETYQYGYRVNIYSGSESAWTLEKQTTFTYDGWNLIEEVEASVYDSNNSVFTQFRTSNYTWGLDLSQTIQGAGGVGGLLAASIPNYPFVINNYYYTYDANGNVSELIDTAGVVKAHYEYSPFGKVVHKSGLMKDKNPFQFSTKYLDNETQLYYYGLRYYNPENGRWINRDPIAESGGESLYSFVANNISNSYDFLGMWSSTTKSFGKSRRVYEPSEGDTLKSLAKLLKLDYSDIDKWAIVTYAVRDGMVGDIYEICSVSVPNEIIVTYGNFFSVLGTNQEGGSDYTVEKFKLKYKSAGYKFIKRTGASQRSGVEISNATRGDDLYGWLHFGHSGKDKMSILEDNNVFLASNKEYKPSYFRRFNYKLALVAMGMCYAGSTDATKAWRAAVVSEEGKYWATEDKFDPATCRQYRKDPLDPDFGLEEK